MAAIQTPILPILEFLQIQEATPIRAVEPTVSRKWMSKWCGDFSDIIQTDDL